jgi:hemin uptake protein HemP
MPARQSPSEEQLRETSANSAHPRVERVVTTRELLGGSHRIWIEHAAQRYLLQVTRSGKLILTK